MFEVEEKVAASRRGFPDGAGVGEALSVFTWDRRSVVSCVSRVSGIGVIFGVAG